jgi:hypothetical protein
MGQKMEDGDLTIVVRTQHSSGGRTAQVSNLRCLAAFGADPRWLWILDVGVFFCCSIIVNPHLFPIYILQIFSRYVLQPSKLGRHVQFPDQGLGSGV